MKVKFTTTPEGELATIPRAEYERLVMIAQEAEEDMATARLVARAKKDIAGGVPLLPKDVVDRLANGENPIRVLREFRDYTQAELVVAVGITQGYLSDLETGKRKGPLELHQKFAKALGVPLELLTPIAVSLEQADPQRFARRKKAVAEMRQHRR
ncbi:MAG: helix-turn-helix transcriptional regulator [Xanthobacteraceae bacterium]|nr:helix-turn-helix transcriptional regulator [Xanthobacteraceae bacterium]